MNFSSLIIEFLKTQNSVSVPGFGVFYLKKTSAILDQDGKSILPPAKEVAFRTEDAAKNNDFAKFVSTQKSIPLIDAEIEVRKLVNFWNSTLEKEGILKVENLGNFFLNDHEITFNGERIESLTPDFYGLEKIQLSEIKNKTINKTEGSYLFSKSFWWFIPLLFAILGLTYIGVTQPETIFGKKSFSVSDQPKKTVKAVPVKKDSAQIQQISDSIKIDSAKTAAVPAKKWNSKKYSKTKKWQKSKKRQTH